MSTGQAGESVTPKNAFSVLMHNAQKAHTTKQDTKRRPSLGPFTSPPHSSASKRQRSTSQQEPQQDSVQQGSQQAGEPGSCDTPSAQAGAERPLQAPVPHDDAPASSSQQATSSDAQTGPSSKEAAVAAFTRAFSGGRQPAQQKFEYLLVYDLEATCNQSRSLQPIEIIELSCVIIHTASASIKASYQSYVRPTEHPQLDPFCVQLTGIQQHQVDAAPLLADVLQQHDTWLRQQGVLESSSVPMTWTEWDFKIALCTECAWRHIQRPSYLCCWVDLKKHFKAHYQRAGNLKSCVEMAGLKWQGREHSGLDDAMNTARLALHLMRHVTFSITQVSENPPVRQPQQPMASQHDNDVSRRSSSQSRPAAGSHSGASVYDAAGRWLGRCHCGVKAKQRVTKRPGPNHGRQFWSCGCWRIEAQQSSSCSFFLWADEVQSGSSLPSC